MSYVLAKDISQYQGNWQDTGEPIVVMKASGGDAGLYFDSKCAANYAGATAAGKAVGLYHFIGWTMGAEQEAAFFLKAVSPFADGDVYALDVEKAQVPVPPNAVQYVLDMVSYIHQNTGVYPLVYMNLSTLNQFDWSPVLANCGLWLADWAVSPDANIPTSAIYVMQQYADGPNYDHDAWFGTVEQFKAYGYKGNNVSPAPQAPPQPSQPETPSTPTPENNPPETPPADNPAPAEPTTTPATPAPSQNKNEDSLPPHTTPPAQEPPKVIVPEPHTYYTFWQLLVALIKRLFGVK